MRYTAAGCLLALLGLGVWGVWIEPRLIDVRHETAVIRGLPREWDGQRIALLADLQIGMWFGNEETVTRLVDRIVALQPAAVLFAGDLVYHPTEEDEAGEVEQEDMRNFADEISRGVGLLRPLIAAGLPVYAVLGNHDYGMSHADSVKNERLARAVREALVKAGITVLQNSAVRLGLPPNSRKPDPEGGTPLYLAGLDSYWAGNSRPEAALAEIPPSAARLILMHNPDGFSAFPPHSAPLAMAGHTHGGQIRLPFTRSWSWMALVTEGKVTADGWIRDVGSAGNNLYVNRGIGFSSLPVRINCRPELTVFTLRGEAPLDVGDRADHGGSGAH